MTGKETNNETNKEIKSNEMKSNKILDSEGMEKEITDHEVMNADLPFETSVNVDLSKEELAKEDSNKEESNKEESNKEESNIEDSNKEESNKEDSNKEDSANEESEEKKQLSKEEIFSIIEAVLFACGNSVRIDKLSDVIGIGKKELKKILEELQEKYESAERGIELIFLDDSVQLGTKSSTYEYLAKIARMPQKYTLTDTMLETLSIIAYKQPVTRAAVEKIRGVNCDHALNKLLEYELIEEIGRLDAPGRPILFGTSEQFLRSFGVKSIADLPSLGPELVEEMKQQAEEEINNIGDKDNVKVEV